MLLERSHYEGTTGVVSLGPGSASVCTRWFAAAAPIFLSDVATATVESTLRCQETMVISDLQVALSPDVTTPEVTTAPPPIEGFRRRAARASKEAATAVVVMSRRAARASKEAVVVAISPVLRRKAFDLGRPASRIEQLASFMGHAASTTPPLEKRQSRDAISAWHHRDATLNLSEMTFVRKLGEGGFATVSLYSRTPAAGMKSTSTCPSTPVQIAVKHMKKTTTSANAAAAKLGGGRGLEHESGGQAAVARFQAEAILLRELRHPNVVACYGSILGGSTPTAKGHQDGGFMFAQEFCEGGTLLSKLELHLWYAGGSLMTRVS